MSDDVMIAVDPHKASNTAAVLDPVTKTLVETARFANTDEGYALLAGFARRWEDRRWAVEGCRGAGRSLAQRLVADGEDPMACFRIARETILLSIGMSSGMFRRVMIASTAPALNSRMRSSPRDR